MSISCMICLAISLVAGCLSVETDEEIVGILSVSIAAICAIACVILAAWPVQLLLVFVLMIVSKLSTSDDPSRA